MCLCTGESLLCVCVCVGQRAMTTAACTLTGGFITASDRASSKTPSEEYTLCVGQNKHPASSGGTINYLYHRQNSRDALNIATCSSGRVKDDLCLIATLNFTAIGPCAFWGLGRHKMVVINCCSCSLETQNGVEGGPTDFSGFCLFLHNMPWSSSSSSVSPLWSVDDIEMVFSALYVRLNVKMLCKNAKYFNARKNVPNQSWIQFWAWKAEWELGTAEQKSFIICKNMHKHVHAISDMQEKDTKTSCQNTQTILIFHVPIKMSDFVNPRGMLSGEDTALIPCLFTFWVEDDVYGAEIRLGLFELRIWKYIYRDSVIYASSVTGHSTWLTH